MPPGTSADTDPPGFFLRCLHIVCAVVSGRYCGNNGNVKKMNNETVLKLINNRIDELADSYKTLNDHHQTLENGFIEMKTEWKTTKSLVKYVLGTSLLGFMMSLLNILKLFGVI